MKIKKSKIKSKKFKILLSSLGMCVAAITIYSVIGAIYTVQKDSDRSDAAVESNVYLFDNPGNYNFDTGEVEVAGGKAQLKQQTLDFTDDSEAEFNSGTYNDTAWETDHLELQNNEIESDSDTIGLFHLNNSSGNVFDSSGYGNDGTNYGAARGVSGQYLNAFEFDGINDYVETPDASHLEGMSEFSMEAWIYPYSTGSEYMIVNKESTYEMAVRSGVFQIALWTDVSGWTWLGTQSVPTNDWTHVVMVYDGSNMKIYINGVYKEQFAKTGNVKVDTTNLRIGRRGGASYFHGKIDEVALYDTALDSTTIAEHANWGLYNSSGQYTSQIFNAESIVPWSDIIWLENLNNASNWFNSNWSKRRTIEVDNSSNSNSLSNYQVKTTVTYDSDMKNDFSDLRFTDNDGVTLIDYFVASKIDGVSADVWVEVPSVPASASKDIYMYYGNNSASSLSNGADTMLFYDDYSTDTIANYTQTLFSAHGGGGPDFLVSGGYMTTGTSNACQGIYHSSFTSPTSVYIETYETGVTDDDGIGILMRSSGGAVKTGFLTDEHQSPGGYKVHAGGDTFTMLSAATSGTTGHPTPHKIALAIDQNSKVYMWKDSTLVVNGYDDAGFTPQRVGLVSLANNPTAHYDYLFAKNYSYPEPSALVFGTETTEEVTDIQIQIRSCDDALCDTEVFIGPDGTGSTYYTNSAGENLNVSDNQYIQYQINFSTTDSNVSPEVSSITIGSDYYPDDLPTVMPNNSLQPSVLNGWFSFLETSAKPAGTNIYYQLSGDNGASWQYFDGGSWSAAGVGNFNTASVVNLNISSFDHSSGKILFKAFLESNGADTPEIDSVQIDYLSEDYTFNGVNDWPFDVPADYTYDTSNIEITGSNAQLKTKDFLNYEYDTQSEFDAGSYNQTSWDSDHVELSTPIQPSGNYISDIMDAGDSTSWNNLSWIPEKPYYKEMPDNKSTETAYPNGNLNMNSNDLLLHMNEYVGATNFSDSSGSGNNGSCAGGSCPTSAVTGKLDTGLSFDGNDVINISESALMNYTDKVSYGAWFKANSFSTWAGIMSRMRTWGNGYNLQVGTSQKIACGWGVYTVSNTAPLLDQWYHAVCVYDGTQMKLYVNGVLQDDIDNGILNTSPDNMKIGVFYTSGSLFFDGVIDEAFVFHKDLTASDVMNIYQRGALKLKYQVRSCDDPVCDTEIFTGPDGTALTYYSELDNSSIALPSYPITNLPDNRYLQFKTEFETDNTSFSPELKSVSIDTSLVDFYTNRPFVTAVSSITPSDVVEWNSFLETATKPSGTEIYYQLSDDDGAAWYWWNDLAWVDVQAGYPPYSSNVGLYRLNQTTDDVIDSSGYANHGTNYGAVRGIPGWFGNSFQFDGIDDYIEIPHSNGLNLYDTDFSIEFWLKTLDANAVLIKKYTGIAGGDAWGVRINSGILEFYDGVSWISSDETVNDDIWKYITITGDKNTNDLNFYIDGDLKKTTTYTDLTTNTLPLYIGREVTGQYFSGQMDEIRISDVKYSVSYILDHIWLYNTASEIDANIELFPIDNSKLNFKAYLASDGDNQVKLDLLRVGYKYGINIVPIASVPTSISHNITTGYVSFQTNLQDNDLDDTKLKVEYSDDGGANWYDPFLVSATLSTGSADLNNLSTYQIGTINNIDTSTGPVTLSVVWDTKSINNGNGSLDNTSQTDIRLRVTPNDLSVDGLPATSGSFTVDNISDDGGQQGEDGGQFFGGGGGGGGGGYYRPDLDEEEGLDEEGEGEESEEDEEGESDVLCDELTDINNHWARQYIYYLWQNGVVCGKTPGIFDPNYPITRAEFVKIILLALDYKIEYSQNGSVYTDIRPSDWYFYYILTATNSDILQGYSDSTFRPLDFVNRAEALKILLLASGIDVPEDGYADFPDIIHGSWYEKYIALAKTLDIVTGYENGNFGPEDPLTRAEACKIVYKLLEELGRT